MNDVLFSHLSAPLRKDVSDLCKKASNILLHGGNVLLGGILRDQMEEMAKRVETLCNEFRNEDLSGAALHEKESLEYLLISMRSMIGMFVMKHTDGKASIMEAPSKN